MIQIRPVSDLRNKFPEIEMLVNEGQPVYLTKNGYGAMVVLSLEEYASLVDNVEMLQRIAPEVRVNLRVNIDATTQDDFIELHRFFTDKHYPNLVVSPAFVTDLSGCNVDDCIFDTERKLQFIFKMKQEHGLNCIPFYPLSHRYECTVRNANTVVIGPEGELYKCWNDVGNKDAVVGYVDGKITNETLLLRYLTGADPFEDPKCRECLLLPVCGGGCPLQAEALFGKRTVLDKASCIYYKKLLEWLIKQYFYVIMNYN